MGNERSSQPAASSRTAKSIKRSGEQCFARTRDEGLDLAKRNEAQEGSGEHARQGRVPDMSISSFANFFKLKNF